MPALVGVVQVITVANAGIFNIGDIYKVNPVATSRAYAGAGSFNTGNNLNVDNYYSATNIYDQDGIDQPLAFNF